MHPYKPWRQSLALGLSMGVLVLLLQAVNAFNTQRLLINDLVFAEQPVSDEIVIIAIDDMTLSAYGRTPVEWPRSVYVDLVQQLAEAAPRVLAFDLIFSEPTPDDEAFAAALQDLRQRDARTRIVLGGAGVNIPVTGDGLRYEGALQPVPPLRDSADYIGYVNTFPDVDGRIRRQTSLFTFGEDERGVSLNVATYLAYLRIPAVALEQVVARTDDGLTVTPQRTLPADENGIWRLNYFGPPGTMTTVSFLDVVSGAVEPDVFTGKIVMVGMMNSTGAILDQYFVPLYNELMSGVEIQAHAVETLIQDAPLRYQSTLSQIVLILALSLFASTIYSHIRWFFEPFAWLSMLIVGFFVASWWFDTQHIVANLFDAIMAITLPLFVSIGIDITTEVNMRRQSEFLLQSLVKIASQKLNLADIVSLMAQDIQRVLPQSNGKITIHDQLDRNWQHFDGYTPYQYAQPITWQHQEFGTIEVCTRRKPGDRATRFLSTLAKEAAPIIENALLHRRIENQNQLLESILLHSPSSIVVIDRDYHINRCNSAFLHVVQKTRDDVIDVSLPDLLPLEGEQITRQAEDTQTRRQQIKVDETTLSVEAARLPDTDQCVIILNDVTDLVELNQLKTQMLRMASHDLKNPLSRINGYGQLIVEFDKSLEEDTRRYLGYMMDASDEMLRIISDILDLEQLRSGKYMMEPLDFKDMVMDIIRRYEPDIEQKSQTLHVDLPDTLFIVDGDYSRLSQAVSNLLSNAVKYTLDKGEITVRLVYEDTSVRLEVKDTGVGIPREAQEKLFTEFYRVKSTATANIAGTGLGLSFVKSIVEAHEGEIWLESEEGEGSTFFVRLPLEKDLMAV